MRRLNRIREPFLLVLLSFSVVSFAATPCSEDADCIGERNTYCEQNTCTILIDTGRFCRSSTECASYAILGDDACTGSCNIEASCDIKLERNSLLPRNTGNCCRGAPYNSTCDRSRYMGSSGNEPLRLCDDLNECGTDNVCTVKGIESGSSWIIGVSVAVLGSVTLNIGLNIQKYAFRANESLPDEEKLPLYRMPFWLLGFAIFTVGNLGNFISLNYAAQSLIAPLGAVGLVSNAIAAPLINQEPIGRGDIISILFIVTGSVMVVVFSSHEEQSYSLCALISFYKTTGTIALLTVMCSLIVLIWFFIQITEINRRPPKRASRSSLNILNNSRMSLNIDRSKSVSPARSPVTASPGTPGAGVGRSLSNVSGSSKSPTGREQPVVDPATLNTLQRWTRRLMDWRARHRIRDMLIFPNLVIEHEGFAVRWLLPFSYATIGGIMGALTVLFAKSSAELVAKTISGENQFIYPFTYFVLAAMGITSVGQIYYINLGLKHYDALLQVPVFYVVWTIFGVVCGGVYFGEFDGFDEKQAALFFLGIFCVFVGVSFLAGRLRDAALDDLDIADSEAPPQPTTDGTKKHPSTGATHDVHNLTGEGSSKIIDSKTEDGQKSASNGDSTILKLAKVDEFPITPSVQGGTVLSPLRGQGKLSQTPATYLATSNAGRSISELSQPIKAPAELIGYDGGQRRTEELSSADDRAPDDVGGESHTERNSKGEESQISKEGKLTGDDPSVPQSADRVPTGSDTSISNQTEPSREPTEPGVDEKRSVED